MMESNGVSDPLTFLSGADALCEFACFCGALGNILLIPHSESCLVCRLDEGIEGKIIECLCSISTCS